MKRKACLLLAFALLSFCNLQSQTVQELNSKLMKAFSLIRYYHVDSVDSDAIVEEAVKAMIKELDPHSFYMNAKQYKEVTERLHGNFMGIGIQFSIIEDTLVVVSPLTGGPSEKLGVMAGDRIVMVDDKNIAGKGINNEDVYKYLRGPKDSEVTIAIKRDHAKKLIEFNITRAPIPIYSIDAKYMIDERNAYIKINRFAQNTALEFQEAIIELQKQGMQNLIVDLRGNSGGYLISAVRMLDEFFESKKLVVYTQGRHVPKKEYFTENGGLMTSADIVVLIDSGSASASEILAGAVQDWDRGLIIGRRSFGKALVQNQFELADKSAIRLTIGKYYTPSGRLIQKPYQKDRKEYRSETLLRLQNGELTEKDSIHVPDSLCFYTKIHKRKVFGGGGIIPDVFVPYDSLPFSNYYRDLIRFNILTEYHNAYFDKNRESLKKKYENLSVFDKKFSISKKMFSEFIMFADKQLKSKLEDEELKVLYAYQDEDLERSKELIKTQMKALIARDLFDRTAYFKIINQQNNSYLKAVELLGKPELFRSILYGE